MAGDAGITSIEDSEITVKGKAGLFIPSLDAIISVVPSPMPVAKPLLSIVAVSILSLVQFTLSDCFSSDYQPFYSLIIVRISREQYMRLQYIWYSFIGA
jgi:hypothetical protein